MKKSISILLVFVLSVSLGGCTFLNAMTMENVDAIESVDTTENAKVFYEKVNESKVILDLVATDVCAAWKDAQFDYNLSTKDVNNAIEKAKKAHSENITKINELDKEIVGLFSKAKDEMKNANKEYVLKRVMTSYSEYKESILNANEALEASGYLGVSLSKDSLDSALQDLFVEL